VGSVILGVVLLSEQPSGIQLAGVAVVLGGVTLANLGRRAARPAVSASGSRG
jgi:drug/metabolite transporter (DMT)-like permease